MKKYLKKIYFFKLFSSIKLFLKLILKKNKINTIIILLFFSIFVFSGCNEFIQNNDNNSKKVQILNFNITTEWSTGCTCDNTYEYHIETGFYNPIYMSTQASYFIKGELKNIWIYELDEIFINLDFFSKNGTFLFDTELLNATFKMNNLSKEEIKSFSIEVNPELYNYYEDPNFYNQLREYFKIVDSLEFDILTS